MLSYLYVENPIIVRYDEKSNKLISEPVKVDKLIPTIKKETATVEPKVAGIELKYILYFFILLLILKLFKVI